MKKKAPKRPAPDRDTMLPEYDFSKGVRGKAAMTRMIQRQRRMAARKRAEAGLPIATRQSVHRPSRDVTVIVLDPSVLDVFPDAATVNKALRALAADRRRQKKIAGRKRGKK